MLHEHTSNIEVLAFSLDSKLLASSGDDETICLWDVQTGELCNTLRVTKPYQGMRIKGINGLTSSQKQSLRSLGAIESYTVVI